MIVKHLDGFSDYQFFNLSLNVSKDNKFMSFFQNKSSIFVLNYDNDSGSGNSNRMRNN